LIAEHLQRTLKSNAQETRASRISCGGGLVGMPGASLQRLKPRENNAGSTGSSKRPFPKSKMPLDDKLGGNLPPEVVSAEITNGFFPKVPKSKGD